MPKYMVAGIIINYEPFYQEYHKTFEPFLYKGNQEANYTIKTFVKEHIDTPKGISTYTNDDRYIITDKDGETIFNKNKEGETLIKTYQSHDLKTSMLYLKESNPIKNAEREYIFSGMFFMKIALQNKRLGLHGSAIELNGEAIIFSAPSKTGKSTHRKLWENHYEISIINDDKPLLMLKDNVIWVHPSPWSGKSRLTGDKAYPLKTIVFLKQGKDNKLNSIDKKTSFKHLMRNCYRPDDSYLWNILFEILEHITTHIPHYKYVCTKNNEAAHKLYNKLFGGHHEN